MAITESEALSVLSVAAMKTELRIPATETSHDALLTSQIVSAVSFCARSTGAALADLPRPAIVAAVRSQYDGNRELGPRAAVYGWLAPFRSYKSD